MRGEVRAVKSTRFGGFNFSDKSDSADSRYQIWVKGMRDGPSKKRLLMINNLSRTNKSSSLHLDVIKTVLTRNCAFELLLSFFRFEPTKFFFCDKTDMFHHFLNVLKRGPNQKSGLRLTNQLDFDFIVSVFTFVTILAELLVNPSYHTPQLVHLQEWLLRLMTILFHHLPCLCLDS